MTDAQMKSVQSSNLDAVGYVPNDNPSNTGTLYVRFHSGVTWAYFNVPPDVHDELTSHASPGSVFARRVKQRYDGERMPV